MATYGLHDKISAFPVICDGFQLKMLKASADAMGVAAFQVDLSPCRLEVTGVFAVPRAHAACGVPSHRWADGEVWPNARAARNGFEDYITSMSDCMTLQVERLKQYWKSKLDKPGVDRLHL